MLALRPRRILHGRINAGQRALRIEGKDYLGDEVRVFKPTGIDDATQGVDEDMAVVTIAILPSYRSRVNLKVKVLDLVQLGGADLSGVDFTTSRVIRSASGIAAVAALTISSTLL